MNLNTYRCGCGRIETLPHAKARPGPCVHVERPRLPEKTFERRELLGGLWDYTVHRCDYVCNGERRLQLSARRKHGGPVVVDCPGNTAVGIAWDALQTKVAGVRQKRQERAEGFFAALRGLIRGIRAATVNQRWPEPGGMRPRAATFAAPYAAPPGHIAAEPFPTHRALAVPYVTDGLIAPTYQCRCVAIPVEPALGPKGRWHVSKHLGFQHARAAKMYCEGLEHLGLRAYVLVTQIKGGVDVVRVAFDTEEMEDTWVDAVNYRLDLVDRIQTATGVALGHLLDVPGKRPSWFPADV